MTAQSEAKPVALQYASDANRKSGWTLEPDYLTAIKKAAGDWADDAQLETVEAIILASRPTVTEAQAREAYLELIRREFGDEDAATRREFYIWLSALRWREGVGK